MKRLAYRTNRGRPRARPSDVIYPGGPVIHHSVNDALTRALVQARKRGVVGSIYLTAEHTRQLRAELGKPWNWSIDKFDDEWVFSDRDFSAVIFEDAAGSHMIFI